MSREALDELKATVFESFGASSIGEHVVAVNRFRKGQSQGENIPMHAVCREIYRLNIAMVPWYGCVSAKLQPCSDILVVKYHGLWRRVNVSTVDGTYDITLHGDEELEKSSYVRITVENVPRNGGTATYTVDPGEWDKLKRGLDGILHNSSVG